MTARPTPAHDEAHEAILRDVLTGDRSASEEAVTRLQTTCTECREQLGDYRGLGEILDEEASLEREVLQAARRATSASGDRQVSATFRRLVTEGQRRAGERGRPTWSLSNWLLAAAASLTMIGGLGFLLQNEPSSPSDPVYLGGAQSLTLAPLGRTPAGDLQFRWEGQAPRGGCFEVRVWRAADQRTATPLLTKLSITATSWTPAPEQAALLSGTLRWEVRVVLAQGVFQAREEREDNVPGS